MKRKKMAREKSDFGVRTFYCNFDLALIRLGHGQTGLGCRELQLSEAFPIRVRSLSLKIK